MASQSKKLFYLFTGLSALFAAVLAVQLFMDPCLRGWDAYYYAVKIDSWFRTGTIQHPDGNLIFFLATPFKWLGMGAANAFRCWQITSLFLFLFSFVWILRLVKNSAYAWVAFIWATVSPMLLYLCISFPKMFAFLICFNGVFYYTIKRPFKWWAWGLWACVSILLHKMAVPYVFITAVWLLLSNIRRNSKEYNWMIGSIACVLLFFIGLQLTNVYSFSLVDLSRITSRKMVPGALSLFLSYSYPFPKRVEILCLFLWIAGCIWYYRKNIRKISLPILWCGVSFLPAFADNGLGIGERFGLLLPYFAVISFIWLTYDEETNWLTIPFSKYCRPQFLIALLVTIGCVRFSYAMTRSDVSSYMVYSKWVSALKDKDIPLLITPKGFEYYYKFHTGKRGFAYAPEDHWPKEKVYRLLAGISAEDMRPYVPQNCQEQLWGPVLRENSKFWMRFSVIREDCWQQVRPLLMESKLFNVQSAIQQDNVVPFKKRPPFLYRKHLADDPKDPFPALPPASTK